jgi:YbbR domain-containing protein
LKKEKLQRHTLKILSILLAVSLWFFVLNSEPVEIEKKLPLKYILPKGLVLLNFSEKEVTLKLKGSKAFITNVFNNKEKFTVDLNPYYKSLGKSFKVKLYSTSVEVPFGVDILDISPKEVAVELDQQAMTELPVKIQFIGDLNRDRKLKEFHLIPDRLMVSGPIDVLKNINKVETVPINLNLLNKDEGNLIIQTSPLDPRIKFEENVKIKFNYKTKSLLKD